jgi:hypothetical protein
MSKQPQKTAPRYSRFEKQAEIEIDSFLQGVSPPSPAAVFEQLKDLA